MDDFFLFSCQYSLAAKLQLCHRQDISVTERTVFVARLPCANCIMCIDTHIVIIAWKICYVVSKGFRGHVINYSRTFQRQWICQPKLDQCPIQLHIDGWLSLHLPRVYTHPNWTCIWAWIFAAPPPQAMPCAGTNGALQSTRNVVELYATDVAATGIPVLVIHDRKCWWTLAAP